MQPEILLSNNREEKIINMRGLYRWTIAAVIMVMALSVLLVGCGHNTVAKVNGHDISRDEYITGLEQAPLPGAQGQTVEAGMAVLNQLIRDELTMELAASKKVSPTEKQINDRIADLKKRQPNLNQILKERGITPERLHKIIAVQQATFNLQTRGVTVPDKDVKEFYDTRQELFTLPKTVDGAIIMAKDKATADKAISMLKEHISVDTVARSIASKSAPQGGAPQPFSVVNGKESNLLTSCFGPSAKDVQAKILNTPEGSSTEAIQVKQGPFLIFQVTHVSPLKVLPFSDVEYGIRTQLMQQKGAAQGIDAESDLQKFRDSAKLDISIERYKKALLQKSAATGAPPTN